MNTKKICLNANFGAKRNRGKAFTSSVEDFNKVINSPELADFIKKIRNEPDKKKQEALKQDLPFRCAHYYHFNGDNRKAGYADPEAFLFQTVFDIDEPEYIESALKRAKELNDDETSMWYKHVLRITYSVRHKLHIDIRLPLGMTIEETQTQFGKDLGVPFDPACTTPERFIYLTDASNEVYRSDDWCMLLPEDELERRRKAYTDRGLPIDGVVRKDKKVTQKEKTVVKAEIEDLSQVEHDDSLTFDGIPYTDIIRKYWELYNNGMEPIEGCRHSLTWQLAVNLRAICDYNQTKLEQVIPNYWHSQEDIAEYRATIASANAEPRKGMPTRMAEVLKAIKSDRLNNLLTEGGNDDNHIPVYTKTKPAFIKLISSKVDKTLKAMVEESIWPALCAYLPGNVKFRYIDGKEHEANISSVLLARQSSGKGYINEPIEAILADITVNDDISHEKLDEWRRMCRKRKEEGEEPRPDDICIQRLNGSMTQARFAEAQIDAAKNGKKRCHSLFDEIELVKGISRNNLEELFALIRAAFDTSRYGRDAVGAQFVSGSFDVRYCFNASSTPYAVRKVITQKCVNDGTLTRLNVNTLFRDDDSMPKIGNYDEAYYNKVRCYVQKLKDADGQIKCPQADKLAKELVEEHKQIALESGLEGYRTFSFRACVIGWLKANILYILNDYKWEKCIADYVKYSVRRDMWCKMYYFGKDIEEGHGETGNQRVTVQSVLALLPSEFSEADYMKKVEELGRKGNKGTLRTWVSRGKIYYDDTSRMYVKAGKDAA